MMLQKSVLNVDVYKKLTKLPISCFFSTRARAKLKNVLNNELKAIHEAGTWKEERIITSKQGVAINVEGTSEKILNFCANNYLGLSSHPGVMKAAKEAIDKYGAGLSSVRFICGTQTIHKELERKIAEFHQKDDAILYPSCFDANAGLFEALLTPNDAVFSDELNHASIIDGIRLCKAQKYRYKHRDMSDLEQLLKNAANARLKLVVTDGVFSMDGNIAPLPDIKKLADKYNALTFIDDCHATGFFGNTGRGTEEFYSMMGSIDIINSTLGKAVGGASGGYTTGPAELVDLLRQRGRPYLFSNSLTPSVVASGLKAFDIIINDSSVLARLQHNTKRFREEMTKAGFKIAGESHPICPVMLEDAKLANDIAKEMLGHGIYVIGFSYPVVPKGKARIRVQISAAHTDEDIDRAISGFISSGRKFNVISA